MEGIYNWVKTIVIFMIFLTIISNMLGKSDFKKYINVATGLLLVLVTMGPLLQLLTGDNSFDYFFQSALFQQESIEVAHEMEQAEKNQRHVILEEYKKKICEQVGQILKKQELYLVDASVVIDEDDESAAYGTIQSMTVTATYYAQPEQKNQVKKVEIPKVTLDSDGKEKQKDQSSQEFLSPMEIKVKNTLSDFYNIDSGNINISIQGG